MDIREFVQDFVPQIDSPEKVYNPNLPISEQKPNPLQDHKALDDVMFDMLGLTEEERREVDWAVCELVKNRLEKERSV